MNELTFIATIKQLRKTTHCPIWAIEKCLKLEHNDMNKACERLQDIYFVMGDNPNKVIKRREEELKSTY